MKPISRREWARLVAAVPVSAAPAGGEHAIAGQAMTVAIRTGGGRVLSREVRNRLTGETAALPPVEFALEFAGGYQTGSGEMKVEVERATPSELILMFTGERVQARVERRMPPGKAYLRKQISLRASSGPPLRLLRAELEDWRGVRREWKSMTADRSGHGSQD